MRFVTVTLTAADDGGRLTLYDANGRKVGSVPSDLARQADATRLNDILWDRKLKAMSIVNLKAKEHAKRDLGAWGTKIDTWIASIRLRQVDKRREREGKRYFSPDSRPNWAAAIQCMQFSHRNRLRRKDKHSGNPWLRWAETCSKNHNRKERNRVAERREKRAQGRPSFVNATQAIVGRSELQMCIDWHGVDASAVVA
jgi:hypothetical protein